MTGSFSRFEPAAVSFGLCEAEGKPRCIDSTPTRRTRSLCCPRAASGQAAAALSRSVMKSRRLMSVPPAGRSLPRRDAELAAPRRRRLTSR
jgi:hypothetical protein